MSGKMNWERVHKENLAYRHGSEWVGAAGTLGQSIKKKGKKKRHKKQKKKPLRIEVSPQVPMVGCTCGKVTGFNGEHKKSCPLRETKPLISVRVSTAKKVEPKAIYIPPSQVVKKAAPGRVYKAAIRQHDMQHSGSHIGKTFTRPRRGLEETMTKADEIRDYVYNHYIVPARNQRSVRVTVIAGEVAKALKLKDRMPLVCGAIGALKFQNEHGIQLISRVGPGQGATATFIFKP